MAHLCAPGTVGPVGAWIQQQVQQSGADLESMVALFLHIPQRVAATQKDGASLKQRKAWLQVSGFGITFRDSCMCRAKF